jgi:hypothetical protein
MHSQIAALGVLLNVVVLVALEKMLKLISAIANILPGVDINLGAGLGSKIRGRATLAQELAAPRFGELVAAREARGGGFANLKQSVTGGKVDVTQIFQGPADPAAVRAAAESGATRGSASNDAAILDAVGGQ